MAGMMLRQQHRQRLLDRFPLGTRVRALAPNTSWGEGVVIQHITDPKLKPFIVQRENGTTGHFHIDQITESE